MGVPSSTVTMRWRADGGRSRITLHLFKKGLLSALAHDHHFVPRTWRANATLDATSDATSPWRAHVEVIVAADSLADEQPALSSQDREEVERRAAGPEGLDAQHHSEIRFLSDRLQVSPATSARSEDEVRGVLAGVLSLHGREHSLSVPVQAVKEGRGWRARGTVTFKQSDFGIRPFSGFGGTIAVRDDVRLEYDVLLVPA